jgi:hypothetical protein
MNFVRFLAVSAIVVATGSAYASSSTSTGSTTVTSTTTPNYPGAYGQGSYAGNMAGSGTMSGSQTTMTTRGMTQPAAANGVIGDPTQIRSCLCMENQYKALQSDVAAKQAAYNQANTQEATLDAKLSTGTVPAGQLDQFRAQSEQRIELLNQINAQYIPNLQQATDRYNAAVTAYQQSCEGHTFNADVMAQVRTNLACAQ